MRREKFISFPPGAVSIQPQRIPVLWNQRGAIALNKPAGPAGFEKQRRQGEFSSILMSINERAVTGGQFERLGIEELFSVHFPARESSGVLLFAKGRKVMAELRNAFGSNQFVFRHRFYTRGKPAEAEIECDLPVALHSRKREALISNKTGKKTLTRFRRLEEVGEYSLWESESVYDRFHQVRLHALESGIPVCGDPVYGLEEEKVGGVRAVPFFLHLASLTFPWEGEIVTVEAKAPRNFERWIRPGNPKRKKPV